MNIQMLFTWAMAAGAVCLTLAATLLSLHEKGIRPLDELLRFVRWLGWPGQIICGVCALHLIGYGSNKTPTNPPPAGLPPRQMVVQEPTTGFSAGQIAAGAAIVGVGTNEVWRFDLTRQDVTSTNLNIVERWRLRGAANERVKLNESMAIDTFGRVWTEERIFSPLGLQVGMVPEARWTEIGCESVAWWTVTASNTTVVTWENALLFRETNWPVSVQAEFFDDGRFVYRYDLASLGAATSNIFAQVITPQGVEGVALGEGVTSVHGHLLEAIDGSEPDRDGDGISTYDEIYTYGTNPDVADTDGDGILDGEEIAAGTDPCVSDVTCAEVLARIAGGVTNETVTLVAGELESTKLWDGFAFVRGAEDVAPYQSPDTNTLYERTFEIDRKGGWTSYFLSGRGEASVCSGAEATHAWSLAGAVIDWTDDCGASGTVTNSPSGDTLYLPLTTNATSVTISLRQTGTRVASPQPVYLLAHTPRIEFPGSQGIEGDDGNSYSVYVDAEEIAMNIDRVNRPCKAGLYDGEATEAYYELPSGAGVFAWPGERGAEAANGPERARGRGAEDVAPYRSLSLPDGGRHYLVVVYPWVSYGAGHYGCCHDYPYDWGWFGGWCDCTPECGCGAEGSAAVDAYIDYQDSSYAVGVVTVGGTEVWRGEAYHVVWGCDHDHDDEPSGECPCGCNSSCQYCLCKKTDGPSQGSIRFRVSLGEDANDNIAGFAWFESDGPVMVTPTTFCFTTRPDAGATVITNAAGNVSVTTPVAAGRDLTISAITNGVCIGVYAHDSGDLIETWTVENVSNDASVVRMVRRNLANDVREDWTYACCARSDEWEWTVTDNLLIEPQMPAETVVVVNGTNYVYNASNRLVRLSVGTNDEEVVIRTISYNDDGRPICVDDGTNGCVTIAYDAAGNVSSMTGPEGTLSAAWDENGVMTNLDTSAWNGMIPMMGPRLLAPPRTMMATSGGRGGGMTALDALLHYLNGNGATVTLPFSEVDTNGLTPTDFPAVKSFVSSCHAPGAYPITGTRLVPACGQIRLFLGDVTVSLTGTITYSGHCNWSFTGTMSGEDDTYDFNAANRGMLGESLTAIGRMLFEGHGTNYTVQFAGTATLSGSGHCGER